MDPKVGRFASVDPYVGKVGKPISQHRYLYADQSPVTKSDPTGMYSLMGLTLAGSELQGLRAVQATTSANTIRWFTTRLIVGSLVSTAYLVKIGWDAAKQREWMAAAQKERPLRLRHYTTEKGKVLISGSGVIRNPNNEGNYFTSDLYAESETAADKLATWNEPDFYVELNMYKTADELVGPSTVSSEVYERDGVVKIRLGGGNQYRTDLPIPIQGAMRMHQWIPLTE
jgi:hypothetical protein